jgi:hypothetical protein
MDSQVDQVLTSLKVISMIKEGQKVSVRNGLLDIETRSSGLVTALKRWINNDNRHTTLTYIRNIVTTAMDLSKTHSTTRIKEALKEAVGGLTSLSVTYGDDASIMATIHVMKDRISHITGDPELRPAHLATARSEVDPA